MEPLNEENDHKASPWAIFVDAGAKAILASMRGDTKEHNRQIVRGRKARQAMQDAELDRLIDEADAAATKAHRADERKRRDEGLSNSGKATTNLGDLLRQSDVTAADKKSGR